jgi:hypothetical protein
MASNKLLFSQRELLGVTNVAFTRARRLISDIGIIGVF